MRPFRAAPLITAIAVGLTVAGCGSSAQPPPSYYLSLGDSLAQGVQPNAAGVSIPTEEGYADQLYATLRPAHPGLRLVKLGCPGETTATMIHGGLCPYRDGSQLAAAEAFLRAHRGHVLLVTLDIGANDPEHCAGFGDFSKDLSCVRSVFTDVSTRLGTVVSRLRSAAGPDVRITGMNYYLPAISTWRDGFLGQETARLIAVLTGTFNQALQDVYARYSVPVADVFGAFHTSDFGDTQTVPGLGQLPRNVALLCQWTWQCAAPPRGPNQHANRAGYAVIAAAFARAAGLH